MLNADGRAVRVAATHNASLSLWHSRAQPLLLERLFLMAGAIPKLISFAQPYAEVRKRLQIFSEPTLLCKLLSESSGFLTMRLVARGRRVSATMASHPHALVMIEISDHAVFSHS